MQNGARYIVTTHWGTFSLDAASYQDYLAGKLWISWVPGKQHCLVFAASHYERVIRQNRNPTVITEAAARCAVAKTPYYEHFLEYQRKRDCSEKKELGEEDWAVLQESVNKQLAEYEDLMQKIKKQSCEVDKAFDRVKQKLLADKATELVTRHIPIKSKHLISTLINSNERLML